MLLKYRQLQKLAYIRRQYLSANFRVEEALGNPGIDGRIVYGGTFKILNLIRSRFRN